jgi:uncharacterized membrane protein
MRNVGNYASFILPVGIVAVLITVLSVGWFTQPERYARSYQPRQPIPYSHKLHAGVLRIPCQYCHSTALKSRLAGIPPAEKCMNCHRVTKTGSPLIKEVAAHFEAGEPLKWKRIHSLPGYVFFDHRPHVHAGIVCQTCHGEVQTEDIVYQQMSLRMSNCLGCHRDPRAALPASSKIERGPEDCNACHR